VNSEELRKLYASAPVVTTEFEVASIHAPWFSRVYYLQNVFTETIRVRLETGVYVDAEYAPMSLSRASSNADLNYERNVIVSQVNDILAAEQANFNPNVHNPDSQYVQSRVYIRYADGTFSNVQGSVVTTYVRDITRNSENYSSTIRISSKPANDSATGEIATISRVPMLKGFI